MHSATIAGVAVLALSTAALAQVARTPAEQKNAPANAASADPLANGAAGNTAMANDPPASDTGTPADAKTEAAAPRR